MSQELGYGLGRRVRIDVADDSLVAHYAPQASPQSNPREAVKSALSHPLGFPPLQTAVVPEDRVAIALSSSVPQVAEVVAGVVECLLETGHVAARDICVVYDGRYDEQRLRAALSEEVGADLQVQRHDPDDADRMSYLAASDDGAPIYINRSIVDADVVIPIGTLQVDDALGYVGLQGCLFPTFSNQETRRRFRLPPGDGQVAVRQQQRREAAEAAWLLGSQFTLQIIPGAGDSVLHALAGDVDEVYRLGQPLCDQTWVHRIPRRAKLVVASIEGGDEYQTWDNLARALSTACRAVEDEGAVVLCTRLREKPGPGLRRLADLNQHRPTTLREIEQDTSHDAVSASVIAEAQERIRIYLMSELDGDEVEDLGLGHISAEDEVSRLSRQYESCLLLANAHYAAVRSNDL